MDKLIGEYEIRLVEPECAPGAARWGVQLSLPADISGVFPYLNAVMDNAWYDHENRVLILREPDQTYAMRPNEIRVARVKDRLQAQQIAGEVVDRVNHIWQERDNITPRFSERRLPSVMDIFKLLPRSNCRKCAYPTCMAYAADLRTGRAQLEQCPLLSPPEHAETRAKIEELFSSV